MPPTRRARVGAMLTALAMSAAACHDADQGAPAIPTTQPITSPTSTTVSANGTDLHVERRGSGQPLLLVHGGGEDATMLVDQAQSLATAGFEVITYDRRGTGRSGRDHWPSNGADQHADDAAALLDALGLGSAVVVGVSSGGVIALDMATRHPDAVERVVAWEPPAAGIVPGGEAITAAIMEPVDAHLAQNPGDYVGAQAILLSAIVGSPIAVDDPTFEAARANAEPFIRDEPAITLAALDLDDLTSHDVTIAVGSSPNDLIAASIEIVSTAAAREPIVVDAEHEVYLTDPTILTEIVSTTTPETR